MGTGRVIPGTQPRARGGSHVQRSGPRRPCKGRSGWYMGAGRAAGPDHPSGPVGHLRCPPCLDPPLFQSNGRANLKTARFQSIYYKVSQNGGVSPENLHKACHSPCFQNGLQMSPLGILRFPILVAFSHKELMGLF